MSIKSAYIPLYIFCQGIWKTKKKCSGKGEYVRGIQSSTRSRKSTIQNGEQNVMVHIQH